MARQTRYRFVGTEDGHLWFHVLLRAGWTVCYRLVPRDGRPVVAELRVLPGQVSTRPNGEPLGDPEPPGDGLTAGLVKDEVVVGRHIYEVLPAALRRSRGGVGAIQVRVGDRVATLFDAILGSLGFDPDRKPRRGRRGPKGWPDVEYARLASDYLIACESGSRSPVADVAKSREMTDVALRAALHRARKRGLMTRQTGGRAGGQLTPRARALLRPMSSRKNPKKRGKQ